jgi:transcriptional regulator with XRE-family HTH domain
MSSARKAFVPRESTSTASTASCAPFVAEIKRAREPAGLTLAEISGRCGIDQPALSRLENGHNKNPTLDTLWRYAAAIRRRLVLTTERIRDTRPMQTKARRVRTARER